MTIPQVNSWANALLYFDDVAAKDVLAIAPYKISGDTLTCTIYYSEAHNNWRINLFNVHSGSAGSSTDIYYRVIWLTL